MIQYKKARVVRLSTDKESKISKGYSLLFFGDNNYINKTWYHLYITVDNTIEEPKIGDYIIREGHPRPVIMGDSFYTKDTDRKIIATTDNELRIESTIRDTDENSFEYGKVKSILPTLSDSFIQEYVESNGTIDEVLVEYIEYIPGIDESGYGFPIGKRVTSLKVAEDNEISIKPVVEKSYTKEELIKAVDFAIGRWISGDERNEPDHYQLRESFLKNDLNDWIKEHL